MVLSFVRAKCVFLKSAFYIHTVIFSKCFCTSSDFIRILWRVESVFSECSKAASQRVGTSMFFQLIAISARAVPWYAPRTMSSTSDKFDICIRQVLNLNLFSYFCCKSQKTWVWKIGCHKLDTFTNDEHLKVHLTRRPWVQFRYRLAAVPKLTKKAYTHYLGLSLISVRYLGYCIAEAYWACRSETTALFRIITIRFYTRITWSITVDLWLDQIYSERHVCVTATVPLGPLAALLYCWG
jgi:hypothetical protein